MKKINITDINNEKNISQEEMAQLKGGPHYINWDIARFGASASNNLTLKRG